MRLATVIRDEQEEAALIHGDQLIFIETINKTAGTLWEKDVYSLLVNGQLKDMIKWVADHTDSLSMLAGIPVEEAAYGPLYRHPRKIWGVGFNYVDNEEKRTDGSYDKEPIGFMKPDTTLIGEGESIQLPPKNLSEVVNAEAELAIIIGKTCKNITEEEAADYVAGFTASLDMTAADIHARNPRFLARAKSFDTFFSLGSEMITTDEIPDVLELTVATYHNGELAHRNTVFNMLYRPWFIVAMQSQVMTLLPGDIIMTGTPGSVVVRDGDVVECRISGFQSLRNSVVGST